MCENGKMDLLRYLHEFSHIRKALTIMLLWSLVEKAGQKSCRVPANTLYSSTASIAQWAYHFYLTCDEGCVSFFCGVCDVVGMMTARVITTILRLRRPRQACRVVMTLAVIMASAKIWRSPLTKPGFCSFIERMFCMHSLRVNILYRLTYLALNVFT